jgi:hypothetical protein
MVPALEKNPLAIAPFSFFFFFSKKQKTLQHPGLLTLGKLAYVLLH